MTLIKNFILDTANATGTAFGRLRTAGEGNRLDAEFEYDKRADLYDEVTNNGTVTFNSNTRDLTLSLSDANNGSYAAMCSYPVPYTKGKGQLIAVTGVLDLANIGTGAAEVFLRTSISGSAAESVIAQSSWTALASGIDWQYSQILEIDYQSLKVGTVRYYLNTGGIATQIAQINNDNVRNSGYWQQPSLPQYWKLYTTGGETIMEMGYGNDENAIGIRYVITASASATMKAICATVKSEGGDSLVDMVGLPRSASNDVTAVTASTTLVPILSIRPAATFQTYDNLHIVLPRSFTIQASNPVRVAVIHSPTTLTTPSWTAANSVSCVEYDVSATAVAGGHEVFTDYVTTVANNRSNSRAGLLGKTVLWNRQGSETGFLTIAAIRTGGSDAACFAAINWEEI